MCLRKYSDLASIELDEHAATDLAGARASVVHNDRLRHPVDLPAAVEQPAAQVNLLGVDEEPFVEEPGLVERLAPDEETGSLDGLHALGILSAKPAGWIGTVRVDADPGGTTATTLARE